MAAFRASDDLRDESVAWIQWTRGPRDQDQRTWRKNHLSESIITVDHFRCNG